MVAHRLELPPMLVFIQSHTSFMLLVCSFCFIFFLQLLLSSSSTALSPPWWPFRSLCTRLSSCLSQTLKAFFFGFIRPLITLVIQSLLLAKQCTVLTGTTKWCSQSPPQCSHYSVCPSLLFQSSLLKVSWSIFCLWRPPPEWPCSCGETLHAWSVVGLKQNVVMICFPQCRPRDTFKATLSIDFQLC